MRGGEPNPNLLLCLIYQVLHQNEKLCMGLHRLRCKSSLCVLCWDRKTCWPSWLDPPLNTQINHCFPLRYLCDSSLSKFDGRYYPVGKKRLIERNSKYCSKRGKQSHSKTHTVGSDRCGDRECQTGTDEILQELTFHETLPCVTISVNRENQFQTDPKVKH